MYLDPQEQKLRKQHSRDSTRTHLEKILNEENMNYLVIQDPGCSSNEYWVISKPGDLFPIHEAGKALTAQAIRVDTQQPRLP
jgi:hypothetical protein